MNDIGEALGTTVEGGLFARALSPRAGKERARTDGHFDESACLNCATGLIGSHCHNCGQAAHLHRTLGALGHDLMHGVLHLDGKAWRTLPLLAWKPGELTRRYIHGERASFVSPMALFLFSIFLMFAVFQAIGIGMPTQINTRQSLNAALEIARDETAGALANEETDLAAAAPGSAEHAELAKSVEELRQELTGIEQAKTLRLAGLDSFGGVEQPTGIAFIDRGIVAKWRENPGLMLYKLQANSYKFSWLLIPLSLPFMWLLFAWKRGVRVYDHAIFVTYSIAFMSLVFVALSVLAALGMSGGLLVAGALTIPLLHLARHLRGTYSLSRTSTVWRLAVLVMVIIPIIITLFLQILLVLGAF